MPFSDYDGHSQSPYLLRMQIRPFTEKEARKFERLLEKISQINPKLKTQSEMIEEGFDLGFFKLGTYGELVMEKT